MASAPPNQLLRARVLTCGTESKELVYFEDGVVEVCSVTGVIQRVAAFDAEKDEGKVTEDLRPKFHTCYICPVRSPLSLKLTPFLLLLSL